MTAPTPEHVLREKLERIAPVILAAIYKHGEAGLDYRIDDAVKSAMNLIRECERVAREESKKL